MPAKQCAQKRKFPRIPENSRKFQKTVWVDEEAAAAVQAMEVDVEILEHKIVGGALQLVNLEKMCATLDTRLTDMSEPAVASVNRRMITQVKAELSQAKAAAAALDDEQRKLARDLSETERRKEAALAELAKEAGLARKDPQNPSGQNPENRSPFTLHQLANWPQNLTDSLHTVNRPFLPLWRALGIMDLLDGLLNNNPVAALLLGLLVCWVFVLLLYVVPILGQKKDIPPSIGATHMVSATPSAQQLLAKQSSGKKNPQIPQSTLQYYSMFTIPTIPATELQRLVDLYDPSIDLELPEMQKKVAGSRLDIEVTSHEEALTAIKVTRIKRCELTEREVSTQTGEIPIQSHTDRTDWSAILTKLSANTQYG